MNKNLNDIIPPSRRRILEESGALPPQAPVSMPTPAPAPMAMHDDHAPSPSSYTRSMSPRGGRSFPYGTLIAALVVIGLSVGALFAFSGAKVNITPAMNTVTVAGDFISTLSTGDLPFEVITVEKVATANVDSEGTETVNQAAQGAITIMNKQPNSQQLIKNTRFQTPDGLVFRIRDSVTIPASKNGTPGAIKTNVYADAAGEQYNVGATTFTVPGLKGNASFDLVTAVSDEPMKGGFAGPRPNIGQATREATTAKLKESLAPDIEKELADKVQEGYVLLNGASRVTYTDEPDSAAAGGKVTIGAKAVATAVVFPEAALARAIAYQTIGSYSGQDVELGDQKGLTLTPTGDLPSAGTAEFPFSLAGNSVIVWTVDTAKIAGAVSGKGRDAAQSILAGFPEVEMAQLVLRPFWSSTFPQDPAKINVSVSSSETSKK